jgi:diaminopimelate epimerase
VGNPHAVAFVEEPVSEVAVEKIGHALEHHEEFPEGVNTEFVNRMSPGRLRMRVHERGACETQACGSGAIASATAASQLDPSQTSWVVEMLGGPLNIEFGERTVIEGPAALVFQGSIIL